MYTVETTHLTLFTMEVPTYVQIIFVVAVILTVALFGQRYVQTNKAQEKGGIQTGADRTLALVERSSNRERMRTDSFTLPIADVVPSQEVNHSIPLAEIRQGCSRRDCIPSVDTPEFISTSEASTLIASTQIGIALSYKEEERFYPFSMLVTREVVNDVVAGDALLVTYCPLCGTGIVFDRSVSGVVQEFGVSGMLWQSNLLLYNRADTVTDRNLWSQILGEAVVGDSTGVVLSVVPSDITQFSVWQSQHPNGSVLTTGSQADPYEGQYYEVAQRFAPTFNAQTSPLAPDAYVYGIEVEGTFKAYPRDLLPQGEIRDMISNQEITISNTNGTVVFRFSDRVVIPDVEGFWFSWVAAHPQTLLWSN